MISSIKSKALAKAWEKNDVSGIRPDWLRRVEMILDALDAAHAPQDMNLPGLNFHPLKGEMEGMFSVLVSRNWRIVFRIRDGDAHDVDLVDYHD
jgi:proteic killer suppression protein